MTIVLQSVIFIIRSIFIVNEKSSLFKPDLNKAVKFFRVRENLILAHGKVGQWMNFQVAMRFCKDKPQLVESSDCEDGALPVAYFP